MIQTDHKKNAHLNIIIIEKQKTEKTPESGILYIEIDPGSLKIDFDHEKIGEKIANYLNIESILKGNVTITSETNQVNMAKVLNGFMLTNWSFDFYKEPKKKQFSINFILKTQEKEQFNTLVEISTSVLITRYLSAIAAEDLNPETYEVFVRDLFKSSKVKIDVLDVKALQNLGLNLILAVGNASQTPPRILALKLGKTPKRALIGKGITYDTGGLSLKDTNNMITMYGDMTGSATVMSVMHYLRNRDDLSLYVLMPLAENSIGSRAYRPGDILKTVSGKTVEITNTDAEGRLILADAVAYASTELKCTEIITIATLTGAVSVCFGDEYAGLMSQDSKLANKLLISWGKTGEKLYELPFGSEYDSKLEDSKRADITNSQKGAGTILGGKFIEYLIPKKNDVSYGHIDIAGSYCRKSLSRYSDLANGLSVRAMVNYIENV
jgi:leucyl aminopeptidase